MSKNKVLYSVVGVVLLLAIIVLGAYMYQKRGDDATTNDSDNGVTTPAESDTNEIPNEDHQVGSTSLQSEKGVTLTLTSPERSGNVTSPLSVAGSVPGAWSHEGQFTLRLLNADSNVLAEGAATLDGDWMSENQVPFSASLTFTAPVAGSMGLLVLEKANPSGLQDNADSVTVPIQF